MLRLDLTYADPVQNLALDEALLDGAAGILGVTLDESANRERVPHDRVISASNSRVAVGIVFTNEEIVVARESVRVLGGVSTFAKATVDK